MTHDPSNEHEHALAVLKDYVELGLDRPAALRALKVMEHRASRVKGAELEMTAAMWTLFAQASKPKRPEMEALMNNAGESYFDEHVEIRDCGNCRKVFDAGFEQGWGAALTS